MLCITVIVNLALTLYLLKWIVMVINGEKGRERERTLFIYENALFVGEFFFAMMIEFHFRSQTKPHLPNYRHHRLPNSMQHHVSAQRRRCRHNSRPKDMT